MQIKSFYNNGNYERKIDIHLAKRRVRIFMMQATENLLYITYAGKKREAKMDSYKKKLIQNHMLQQQERIWQEEQYIYKLYNMIAPESPNKDRVRDKLDKEEVYEPLDDDVEKLSVNHFDRVPSIFAKIVILCTERDILFHAKIAIEKHLLDMYKTPRSDELEKLCLAHLRLALYKKRSELYKKMCELYFLELPIDDEYRANAREMILGSTLLFSDTIYNMLYDQTVDDHTIWWNFQELISPDRELQFIVEEVVRHIEILRSTHGPKLRLRDRAANIICWPSRTNILANIDITALIRATPFLKHANDRINDIPSDVFEKRKELFEEIIKTKCWEYMNRGSIFPLTGWANATTYNTGDYM